MLVTLSDHSCSDMTSAIFKNDVIIQLMPPRQISNPSRTGHRSFLSRILLCEESALKADKRRRISSLSIATMKLSVCLIVNAMSLLFNSSGCHALSSTTASFSRLPSLADFDYTAAADNSEDVRLPWIKSGYGTWKWKGEHDINYLELGDPSNPPLLLIHGFGASAYHFRNNIPQLAAQGYHVFAFDKLGFGLSDKPVMDYSASLWRDQAVDFVRDVIGKPCTVAGNSIGGFTALYAAATEKELINGCILLNAAGQFKPQDPEEVAALAAAAQAAENENEIVASIKAAAQRAVIAMSFIVTKQPARIKQVLRQVYPINADMVDDELVESIRFPAEHVNAAEVFYRVIAKNGNGGKRPFFDDLLERLDGCPLLLCWGESDPWIRPAAADKIQSLYPASIRASIDGGHCPQDESPEAVNEAILSFMRDHVDNNKQ